MWAGDAICCKYTLSSTCKLCSTSTFVLFFYPSLCLTLSPPVLPPQTSVWKLCCTGSSYLLQCGSSDVSQLWEVTMMKVLWRVRVCAFAVWGVLVFSGSRTRASVWRSCCFAFRKKTERSKKFFLDLQAKEPNIYMINPKPCGHLCCCVIKGCEQVRLTSFSLIPLYFDFFTEL